MTSRALIDLTTGIGTALGNAVFVAANGDRLLTTGSGQATPTGVPNELSIQGTATIVGGTGRFEGATGSFSGVRLLNTATGISSGSFDGTINLVHWSACYSHGQLWQERNPDAWTVRIPRRGGIQWGPLSPVEAMELLLSKMGKTKSNADFLGAMANGK
jgi:hypothetical protein